jgi:hypothetical protein
VPERLIIGIGTTYAVLWLFCVTLFNPRRIANGLDRVGEAWAQRRGPKPTGLPIEQIAADLRRLIREYERLVRPDADWHRAHHLRACELALYTRAEEAATALGLPPTSQTAGRTAEDLTERLRQLARAGLVIPEIAEMGGDRF